MRKSDQRQDIAFLALGVSTLAIALAIMIGVRAISAKPKPRPSPTVKTEAPAPAPPSAASPPATTTRDPFADQSGTSPRGAKAEREPLEFRLVGMVSAQHPMAVIRRGSRHYYVRVGDMVAGYTLAAIGPDRVTLVKGEERIALELRRPEEEEEE